MPKHTIYVEYSSVTVYILQMTTNFMMKCYTIPRFLVEKLEELPISLLFLMGIIYVYVYVCNY